MGGGRVHARAQSDGPHVAHAPPLLTEDGQVMKLDAEKLNINQILKRIADKRQQLELEADIKELANEWEEEPDPFEEARQEAEKRHQERLRKGGSKKKK